MKGAVIVLVIVSFVAAVNSTILKERIYHDINSDNIRSCFRRLNGTNIIGCTSSIKGDTGVLMYLASLEDVNNIKDKTFAPYTLLVNPEIFTGELMSRLADIADGKHIAGIIVPGVTEPGSRWFGLQPPQGYSDDSKCPGEVKDCSDTSPWNPVGSGNMWEHFDFPIFYIRDSETSESLYSCWAEHNNLTAGLAWPLCSVQMGANMHAAVNSETCIRRSNLQNSLEPPHFCDPLSDVSLHYFVTERNATTADGSKRDSGDKSVLVVIARLDSLTMFDQTEVGFDSPSTGLVTLMATAKMVADTMRQKQLDYTAGIENIMFLLLNGESFDLSGSSRLVYDMKEDKFPHDVNITDVFSNGTQSQLDLTNIRAVLELGQLSNVETGTLFLHSVNNPEDIINKINQFASSQYLISQRSTRDTLPPSSSSKFLTERDDLEVVFLSNFDTAYSNKYYHSVYDNPSYHGYNHSRGEEQGLVKHLVQVSVTLAQTVLSLATNTEALAATDQVPGLINDMLECYTVTANCTMFRQASATEEGFPWSGPSVNYPFPQYVGVTQSSHARQTQFLLQLLTGDIVAITQAEEGDEKKKEESQFVRDQEKCLNMNNNQVIYKYVFLVGPGCYDGNTVKCGQCYKTTVDKSSATSPAFIEEVQRSYDWASGLYPTWTESVWKGFSCRSFLQGSPGHDQMVFGVGLVIFFLSFAFVWWADKNSDLIFSSQSGTEYRIDSTLET